MTAQLGDLLATGVPLFRFGSEALDLLHAVAKDPPYPIGLRGEGWYMVGSTWYARRHYQVHAHVYGWDYDNFSYLVDHGGFFTLQRIERGQVVPASQDIEVGRVPLDAWTAGLRRAAEETHRLRTVLARRLAQGDQWLT